MVGFLGCLTIGWWLCGGESELVDLTSVPVRGNDDSLWKLLMICISFSQGDLFLLMDMFEVLDLSNINRNPYVYLYNLCWEVSYMKRH